MKIASLEPYITSTLVSLGVEAQIVAIGRRCKSPRDEEPPEVITSSPDDSSLQSLGAKLCCDPVSVGALGRLKIDLLLTQIKDEDRVAGLQAELRELLGSDIKVRSFNPTTFDGILVFFRELGAAVGAATRGGELASKLKAQAMDWGDNFYDRTKNKRVCVISGASIVETATFQLAGFWVPDMVRYASAISMHNPGEPPIDVTWESIQAFKPDVIIVALGVGSSIPSMKLFPSLEKLPNWESIPAVKRGEVIFANNADVLYQQTPKLVDGLALIFSAIAGLESGYISLRDSFHRLRWLELQRHRI